ncbi:protein kinase domain-containing protein [Nonomuraea sp. ZG12]|uniref:serine/threonine-protein kinase n=1 Tax=Nonomuraea sp. ZG12 TaxID=3452207 RepID=UPI003F8870EA
MRTIGRGGMGTVWQAYDQVLGRDVALKEVLPPPDLTGPERDLFTVRTFREARAAGRVAHPCVAAVYDVLEEHGHPWIVMQLVRSRTLGELVRDDGPMFPVEVAHIGLQMLEALRAAHAAGVLHRDVKPDNVLLSEDGRAVLTDFGIATTEDEAPVTRTGVLVGTPAYMAPERAAGGQAQPASDLWALGVTLYVAVEGHSPFHRENALATLGAVMHAEPAPLARAGVLGPVLLGLLRKDPAERMSLDEAERRLSAIIAGNAPEATGPVPMPVTAQGRATPPGKRKPPLLALGVGTVMVALVTGGAAWWSHRPAETSAPPPGPAVVQSSPGSPRSPAPSTATETTHPPPSSTATRRADPSPTVYDSPRTMYDSPRRDESGPTAEPSKKQARPEPTRSTRTEREEPERTTPDTRDSPENEDDDRTKTPGQVDPDDGNGQGQEARENPGKKPKKDKRDRA